MVGFYKEYTIKTNYKIIIKKLFINAADDRNYEYLSAIIDHILFLLAYYRIIS